MNEYVGGAKFFGAFIIFVFTFPLAIASGNLIFILFFYTCVFIAINLDIIIDFFYEVLE